MGWFSIYFLAVYCYETKNSLWMQPSDEEQSSVIESDEYPDSTDEEVDRIA